MYVIIIGAGRVGLTLAQSLVKEGINVTLIESDKNMVEDVAEQVDAMVIHGDATSLNVLEDADIEEADVFVAATGYDTINLLACLLSMGYDHVTKIIARVNDLDHIKAFRKAGIDLTVSPESTVATYLERIITKPKIADLLVIGRGSTELLDLNIENRDLVGQRVLDHSPTENFIVCAVYEEDQLIIPREDTVFYENQKISVLTKSGYVQEVTNYFAP